MKTGSFPWKARSGQTLDPRLLNENFRKGADYIRDALKLKYTYSTLTLDLTGMDTDTDTPKWKRRFAIIPPTPFDVVGAELVCNGLIDDDNVFVEWVISTDASDAIRTIAGDSSHALVALSPVAPVGAPSATFKYLEVDALSGFSFSEDSNSMQLRIGGTVPAGLNSLQIGSNTDGGVQFTGGKTGRLTLWLRSVRGALPATAPTGISSEFDMPDLFDGKDPADADIFNNANTVLQTQRGIAVGSLNTYRGEAYVVRDIGAISSLFATIVNQKITARIPSPDSTSGAKFVLERIDSGFVAANDVQGFQNTSVERVFQMGVNNASGVFIDPELPQSTNLGGSLGPYFEIFRIGNELSQPRPELSGTGNDAANSADDNILICTDDGDTGDGAQPIEMVYVYLWYRLET